MTRVDPQRWVLLADPETYGWNELLRDGGAVWDGIRNARAQQNLRSMSAGDVALIYHTAPDKALVGVVRIVSPPYPDPKVVGSVVVDIEPITQLQRRLGLAELKADPVLAGMAFVRMPRVAVQPITLAQWDRVMEMSGTDLGTSLDADPGGTGGP